MGKDNKQAYGSQLKLATVGFMLELPNFFCIAAAAIVTKSLITWMDFIDSTRNLFTSILLVLMSKKLKKDLRYEYNYGVGKVEAIAGLSIDCLMISGLAVFTFFSVNQLIHPQRPSGLLLYVIILKLINVAADYYYYRAQKKITDKGASALMKSELANDFSAFVFDVIAFVSIFVSYIFRGNPVSWIFAPIASMGMEVFFLIGALRRIQGAISVLTDRTLSEDKQLIIIKAINKCYEDYDELVSINSHQSGETMIIDIEVKFTPETTYEEIEAFVAKISEAIESEIEDSHVSLSIS